MKNEENEIGMLILVMAPIIAGFFFLMERML